ncbi:hypothetical protein GTQ34_13125 [Muricauda sp. JGD-17]|uniref:DUF5689 domain-containing protein n=1 Tax=Flagellimonas ochracea TaxID=2696472 RepID=A0A964WYI6_9FLAO|nr:hypothetical protein [Allomuricauda ochracea]NAY92858.1 hypothetical protein [Allomuricauda ochracea]
MKKIKIYLILAMGLAFTISCTEADEIVDQVQETVSRGLVLRTVASLGDDFSISDTESVWGRTLEVQDIEGGALLSEIDIYVSFSDTTIEEGDPDLSTDEGLIGTVSASSFSPGPFGFPRGDISFTYAEAIAASGVDFDDIDGGDVFNFRLEATLTDGRVFTNNAAGTVANGSFFSSPFAYTSPVVCPPTKPTAGTWSVEMQDSFGDGWNNASLDITVDGETTSYTFETGGSASFTFDVSTDAEVLGIMFTSGDFDEEVTAQITSANGNVVLDLQPSPAAGVELLDYCLDNL